MTSRMSTDASKSATGLCPGGCLDWVTCAVMVGFLCPQQLHAHDNIEHERREVAQADTRLTPRMAREHTTGRLPRSRGESTSAKSKVTLETRGGHAYITANGIPNHKTGQFPNRGNPNVMEEQDYKFRIPLNPPTPKFPILNAGDTKSDRGFLFGIALNGVVYEPATGLNWTPEGERRGGRPGGWVYEAVGGSIDFGIDHANAHLQRTGAYHYHGIPTPLLRDDRPTLLGYAADGYPIYGPLGYKDPSDTKSPLVTLKSSWQLKSSDRPNPPDGPGGKPDGRYTADWEFVAGSGNLDRLNGRYAVTPEFPKGVYHYVLTSSFPHIPRGFAGTPDESFRRLPGQGPNHVEERGERLSIGNRGEQSPSMQQTRTREARPRRDGRTGRSNLRTN